MLLPQQTCTGGTTHGIFKVKGAFDMRKDKDKNNKNHTDASLPSVSPGLAYTCRKGSCLRPGCFLIGSQTSSLLDEVVPNGCERKTLQQGLC